ncbi:MAG TPA: HAD family hydrolase [Syntrophomonas sp.]|nr:HAD family hydrolase [Syntrophomonas sp.]
MLIDNRPITGAIFDLDGTLLDTMDMWENIGPEYLKKTGIEARADLADILRPMGIPQAASYLQAAYNLPLTVEQILDDICVMTIDIYKYCLPKAGAAEFVNRLHARNVKLAIATATERLMLLPALRRTGLLRWFDCIVTCTEEKTTKDQPAIFRCALQKLGTVKESTWVFEDAPHAAKTAKRDSFPVVGIFDRTQEKQLDQLRSYSDLYFKSFLQGIDFLTMKEEL